MKKKYIFIIIGIVALLFLLLFAMRTLKRRMGQKTGKIYSESPWTHIALPELTDKERFAIALKAKLEGEAYSERAVKQAKELSNNLEDYIYKWLEGKVNGKLPKGLLPPYIDSPKTHDWKLVKPEEIRPEDQWYASPTYDPSKELRGCSTDPHETFLKLVFIAPLGSKLLIEGDFPHARFMDYQIIQPFDPKHPAPGNKGVGEVPIVDVDIEPDQGHINPFRVGANRNAKNRHYHLTFELRAGNAVDLNSVVMRNPASRGYRGPGNARVGGPFGFAGPGDGNVLVPSAVWLRIYAPDKDASPFGEVPWPKATLQLPTGEKFWLTCDKSGAAAQWSAVEVYNHPTPPMEPYPFEGPELGWFKMFGIEQVIMELRAYSQSMPWGLKDPEKEGKKIRDLFKLFFNIGVDASPPGNHEGSATCNRYNSYLVRPFTLGQNKIIVLTGKLPAYPRTRNGETIMTRGQVRYFSITHHQAINEGEGRKETTVPLGRLMDDEIIVDKNNEYVIVFSRESERPKNATKRNGVTWQEWWGPAARQSITLRWMSVMPDWYLPEYAPSEENIPWKTGAWSAAEYDESSVGKNEPGIMGPYHPVIHYLTKEEFEALGYPVDPNKIPKWR